MLSFATAKLDTAGALIKSPPCRRTHASADSVLRRRQCGRRGCGRWRGRRRRRSGSRRRARARGRDDPCAPGVIAGDRNRGCHSCGNDDNCARRTRGHASPSGVVPGARSCRVRPRPGDVGGHRGQLVAYVIHASWAASSVASASSTRRAAIAACRVDFTVPSAHPIAEAQSARGRSAR